jgi:hypothetical protein
MERSAIRNGDVACILLPVFTAFHPGYEGPKKNGKRNADRRVSNRPRFGRGSVLGGARSPVGVPPRLFPETSERLGYVPDVSEICLM